MKNYSKVIEEVSVAKRSDLLAEMRRVPEADMTRW
jgi:hypothetical protein